METKITEVGLSTNVTKVTAPERVVTNVSNVTVKKISEEAKIGSYKKKYYRKEGRCIMRTSDVKYTEVVVPESPQEKLPLIIQPITLPDKNKLDELVKSMEETDEDMFEQFMMSFIGRVDVDIKSPMSEKQIKRELLKTQNIQSKYSIIKT